MGKHLLTRSLLLLVAVPAFGQETGVREGGLQQDDDINSVDDADTDQNTAPPAQDEQSLADHTLSTVVVTGTGRNKRLKDSPVVTEVITGEEIDASSAASLTDVLMNYGVQFTENPMGSYIRLQGLGQSRVLFLIDGRRITGRVARRLDADTVPLENIERIEIVRGPQSALYGSDALGGVINIITKDPQEGFSASVKITNRTADLVDDFFMEQDLTGGVNFSIAKLFNNISFDLARSNYHLDEEGERSILPRYKRGKVGLGMAIAPVDAVRLSWGGSFFKMQRDEQLTSHGSHTRVDTTRADGHLSGDFQLGKRTDLSIQLYHNYYLRHRDKYSSLLGWEGKKKEEENLSSGEALSRISLSKNNELTVGLGGKYNTLFKYNLDQTGAKKNMDTQYIILQDEQFREDCYSVIAGARVERNSTFGFFAAPKLSGMYHILKGLRVLGGVGVGYRVPSFSELYLVKDDPGHPIVLGNEDLGPEKSIGLNLGVEYLVGGLFTQLNLFYNELFDELVLELIDNPDPEDERYAYKNHNIDRSYRLGADVEAGLRFLKYVDMSAGYNFVYGYNRTDKERLTSSPMHTVRGRIAFDSDPLGLLVYVRGRYISDIWDEENARLILDFYASKNIWKYFRVFAAFDNFTDTKESSVGPYAGIIISVGAKGWF